MTGPGDAGTGKAGEAWRCRAGSSKAWLGRRGKAGLVGQGEAIHGEVRNGRRCKAGLVAVMHGMDRNSL